MKTFTAAEIRSRIYDIQAELHRVESEREALLAMHHGLEAWLRVYGGGPSKSSVPDWTPVVPPDALWPWKFVLALNRQLRRAADAR